MTGQKQREEEIRKELSGLFEGMMETLYKLEGSQFRIEILETPKVQEFIETHSSVLDSSFKQVEMSQAMRHRLERSNYIFSGIKTFHELNQAFPSMLDADGNRKPFEQFLNEVRTIDETYNSNYLKAEYNFVQSSAEMAAKWEGFMKDGDRYNLQYRTAGDDKVRPEHKELDRVTLPITDSFWEEFYPPNGWNCRCTVVQVRKSRYPATPHEEAMVLGETALGKDSKGIFRFNPGKEEKTVPDYNPYTIKRCRDCNVAKKAELAAHIPDNDLCAACKLVRELVKVDAKTTRHKAKTLQGSIITRPDFPHEVIISGRSIKEWTNQPHKHFKAKNRALLDIINVFTNATYLGTMEYHKNKDVKLSHVFETYVGGEKSWIIVREYTWGEYVLHSISDSADILKHIKKK